MSELDRAGASLNAISLSLIIHVHFFNFPWYINVFLLFYLICNVRVISACGGPENGPRSEGPIKKRFFRHFGGILSPISDPSDGQAGANCETFWRVKYMFAHIHVRSMRLSLKRSTFFN